MSIAQDLGIDYLRRNYEGRWFSIREGAETKIFRYEQDVDGRRFQAQPLTGKWRIDLAWGAMQVYPFTMLEDMSSFSWPELGFRHTPEGKLVYIQRPLGTGRGVNATLLTVAGVGGNRSPVRLSDADMAWLVWNDEYLSLAKSLARLQAEPKADGFAISPSFAVHRFKGSEDRYGLYYANRLVGTTTPDGTFSIVSVAAKRLFEKVA